MAVQKTMVWNIVVLLFVAIIAVAKAYLEKKEQTPADLSLYQKKERVMNESEQALFINLSQTLGNEYVVLSKVRIEDFVDVSKGAMPNSRWSLRGRIKSRHIDFLICNRTTTKPLFGIELDGKSHNDPRRKNRDQFVDELYKKINLPIQHILVGENFSESAQKIKTALTSN